jgi:hypothetical protein
MATGKFGNSAISILKSKSFTCTATVGILCKYCRKEMFYCGIRWDFSYRRFCRFICNIIPLQSFNLVFSTKSWLWLDTHKIVSCSVHLSIIHPQRVWSVFGCIRRNTILAALLLATNFLAVTAQTAFATNNGGYIPDLK